MVIGEILGVEKVVLTLGSRQKEVVAVLRTEVRKLNALLMGYVKASKLSGDPLHVQTGRLRRSITGKVTEEGTLISGLTGTNVVYARAHEFGVDKFKVVTVRAHLRKCKSRNTYRMKTGKFFSLQGAAADLSHTGSGIAFVQSFQRNQHIKLPERSFLRSALREMGPTIRADLTAAVMRALREPK